MNEKGFTPIIFILIIFILAGLIIGGTLYVKKNYPDLFQKTSQTLTSDKGQNLNISLLYSITKGRLQDHNYDTYSVTSAQTYKSDVILKDKSPVNIGFTGGKDSQYQYQTSETGKYLIRSSKNSIEIATVTEPNTFTKIFDLPGGKVSWFILSKDESKIVIQYDQAGPKIAILSLNNPQDKVVVVPQRTNDTYFVFGYDNHQNQLYWQRSEGSMTHYTELISLDSSGKIIQTKGIKDFSFITEFDSNFQYAYYEGYGSKSEGYKRSVIQQDLKTGKKNKLAEFPNETGIVNMKLSPTEDRLFFIDNSPLKATNTLYMIDLQTKKMESFLVNPGLNPEKTNYVSPDGKFLIFQITISCRNDDCNSEHEGEATLFDVEKRQFYKLYTPVGIKESAQDDSTDYHDIENFGFIGWLATPGTTSVKVEILPRVTFSEPSPTPAPLTYPVQQFDIQKKKYFFFNYPYPDEVMNMDQKNLVGMKCTPRLTFESPYDSGYHYDFENISGGKITETNPTIIQLVKEAVKTIDFSKDVERFINVTYCQTATNDTILEYQSAGNSKLSNSGGVTNGTDYVGYKPSNGAFKKVATIVLEGRTAHSCGDPMFLTSSYQFYLTCNAFEGPSINKIDLKNASQQRIYDCLHKDRDTGNDQLICQ